MGRIHGKCLDRDVQKPCERGLIWPVDAVEIGGVAEEGVASQNS